MIKYQDFCDLIYKEILKTNVKEDYLFERYTYQFLIGTIDTFTLEYGEKGNQKTLIKLSYYIYVLWLKRGFHLGDRNKVFVKNTPKAIKKEYFSTFANHKIVKIKENTILNIVRKWSDVSFSNIKEKQVFTAFDSCYFAWLNRQPNIDHEWNAIVKQLKG